MEFRDAHLRMTYAKPVTSYAPWRLRVGERRVVLLVGDFLAALLSLGVALLMWAMRDSFFGVSVAFLERRAPDWYYLLPFAWLLLLIELYEPRRAGSRRETVQGIATATLIGSVFYLFLYFYYPPRTLPRLGVAGFFIAASLLTLIWRMVYIRIFTRPEFMRRVLLVGGGETGRELLKITNELWPPPFYLVGILDDDPKKSGAQIENARVLGNSDNLLDIVAEQNVSDIIVAITGQMQGRLFQALLDAHERGVDITRMPRVYEELLGRVPIRLLEADWILRSFVDEARVSGFYELIKRLIDIIGGLAGSLLFLLAFPFVSLAILLDNGLPVFYTQVRSGRGGQLYKILKFRTMVTSAEADGQPKWAKEVDERATRVGRFLRKSHLDELPQFINVLRGEMSLVGPRAERPELVTMFQKHVPFYRARLLVKPGITGWAQINFGYASTIEETITKLEYDLYYIKHRNPLMDIIILLRTPAMVLGFRGR
jgi:exopolysaccharide biosynthesis polyprenyl glycosylphosphotransferase